MESLKYNQNIPDYVKTNNNLETCFNLIRLQNNIKTVNIVKNVISSRKLFISLDTEEYEKNHDYMTEIGWFIFDKTGTILKKKHYIVQEYLAFHNGKYVADNKFNYNFGESETKPLREVKRILNNDLSTVNYIVGQGISNDIRDLKKNGIDLTKFEEMHGEYKINGIIDTQDLFAGNLLEKPIGLQKGLDKFSIPYSHLHNAGNDAYYTMKYFFKLIEDFDINDKKYQNILNIKIPADYKEEDYVRYKNEKKEKRRLEKELKKLSKNRKYNYRNSNYDYLFYDDYDGDDLDYSIW